MLQSNEYFSGKVKSIGFSSSSTGRASVGVMVEGEYTFSTAEPEEMTGSYVLLASRQNNRPLTGVLINAECGLGIRGLRQPRAGFFDE